MWWVVKCRPLQTGFWPPPKKHAQIMGLWCRPVQTVFAQLYLGMSVTSITTLSPGMPLVPYE